MEADKMKYTDELTVSNSRIRNNFADGVNFAQGTRNSKVQNSNVRGNGDDGLAIWSSSKWDKAMRDAVVLDGVDLLGYTTWGPIDLEQFQVGQGKKQGLSQ